MRILIGVNDVQESKKFYDAIFTAIGYEPGIIDEKGRSNYIFGTDSGVTIGKPMNGEPCDPGNGTMISFTVKSREHADAWYAAGIANGGSPGDFPARERKPVFGRTYSTYLHDPDGHKLTTVYQIDQVPSSADDQH